MGTRDQTISHLRAQLAAIEKAGSGESESPEVVSTGFPQLDRLLPEGGLRRGWLVEWLTEPGSGGSLVALWVAHCCLASQSPPVLAVIDAMGTFHPPAVMGWGIPVEELLIIRPQNEAETYWAWEEVLRAPVFSVVWGVLPRLPIRWHRRFQLACEAGRGWGMVLRPPSVAGQPSWSAVQWRVSPLPSLPADPLAMRRWRVALVRCRGRMGSVLGEGIAEIVLPGVDPGEESSRET